MRTNDFDFAVLHLSSTLVFNAKVQPVCLPSPGTVTDNVSALVTGWGTLMSGAFTRENAESECRHVSCSLRHSDSTSTEWHFFTGEHE